MKENEKIHTSIYLNSRKFKLFKVIAMLKYEKSPMPSAWEEAIDLFIKHNKEYLEHLEM